MKGVKSSVTVDGGSAHGNSSGGSGGSGSSNNYVGLVLWFSGLARASSKMPALEPGSDLVAAHAALDRGPVLS